MYACPFILLNHSSDCHETWETFDYAPGMVNGNCFFSKFDTHGAPGADNLMLSDMSSIKISLSVSYWVNRWI